jgi:hypothetical protein
MRFCGILYRLFGYIEHAIQEQLPSICQYYKLKPRFFRITCLLSNPPRRT